MKCVIKVPKLKRMNEGPGPVALELKSVARQIRDMICEFKKADFPPAWYFVLTEKEVEALTKETALEFNCVAPDKPTFYPANAKYVGLIYGYPLFQETK